MLKLANSSVKEHLSGNELYLSPIRLKVDHAGTGVVSHAGVMLPARVAETSGLVEGLSQALAPWRAPTAVFDSGHMLTQLALAAAAGGDHLVDVRELAGADSIVGPVPSHATISRLLSTLTEDVDRVESAVHQAISHAREYVWNRAQHRPSLRAPSAKTPIIIDYDATLITAHSGHSAEDDPRSQRLPPRKTSPGPHRRSRRIPRLPRTPEPQAYAVLHRIRPHPAPGRTGRRPTRPSVANRPDLSW
ncbi:transposase [Dietzia kunjamensis]|uniref:transposase n=1 Tax=Dietzia kunjamensis TaxID=322509 RepID=UPI0039BCC65F